MSKSPSRSDVDVVVVERPDIAERVVGARRAGGAQMDGAGVKDPAVVVKEIAAGGAATGTRDAMQARPVDIDHVLLVAAGITFLALKNELPARGGEIRLGVLTAERQLANVGKVSLARIGRQRPGRLEERCDEE